MHMRGDWVRVVTIVTAQTVVDSSSHSCHPSLFYEGVIGADLSLLLGENIPLTSRLAIICGTSSCHMAVSTAVICYQKVTFLINLPPRFLLFFSPGVM